MPGGKLMDAFRRGVRRDLAGLPAQIEVRELDASHNMVAEQPTALAAPINEFSDGARTRAGWGHERT